MHLFNKLFFATLIKLTLKIVHTFLVMYVHKDLKNEADINSDVHSIQAKILPKALHNHVFTKQLQTFSNNGLFPYGTIFQR